MDTIFYQKDLEYQVFQIYIYGLVNLDNLKIEILEVKNNFNWLRQWQVGGIEGLSRKKRGPSLTRKLIIRILKNK